MVGHSQYPHQPKVCIGEKTAHPSANNVQGVQVVSRNDWSNHKTFQSGLKGDFTAAAWSPNGALLALAGEDLSITLWNSRTQQLLMK